MLFYPSIFKLFVRDSNAFTGLAEDAIRWASPFVFGFSGLAWLSLHHFDGQGRLQVARLFAGCFFIATCVGCGVQSTGRWNDWHPLNIALFGSLGLAYAGFVFAAPQAFHRQGLETCNLLAAKSMKGSPDS